MNRPYLKDKQKDADLENDGYIYIPSFIGEETLNKLFHLFNQSHQGNENDGPMWNSLFDVDTLTSKKISDFILKELSAKLLETFDNFSAPVASFMSKNIGSKGICNFHRDFSILDEEKYMYYNVWIPLVDINEQNGALYVLRASHKKFNYPLPMFEMWPYSHLQEKLFKEAGVINVKAGDLVVYADRTLHGSFLNLGTSVRPVIHLGLLPKDYQIKFYSLENDNVYVYNVPYEFYFKNQFKDVEKAGYVVERKFEYLPPKLEFL